MIRIYKGRDKISRPDFTFIPIDDLGWKDLGCYSSRFCQTPNLDRLGAEGVCSTKTG
jgi:arylsulfatase A-like enzyme